MERKNKLKDNGGDNRTTTNGTKKLKRGHYRNLGDDIFEATNDNSIKPH